MKVHSIVFAAVALIATSAAFAEAPKPAAAEARPAAREQTLLEDVAMGMREMLRTVTPEISLPKLDIKLPTLRTDAR
jgi:hypothetical protein